ncbi:MAG: FtsX-like permease family protein [Candidatus Aminicenantes bacterium]|nr:FtsX-like permease family protein [Candidatus Aminicenantes bacterium]
MKLYLKLAWRNLLAAGLRTWLNVIVLSFAFVAIIWSQGLYRGLSRQAAQAMMEAEIGGGQYWHENYDPYNPLTLDKAHGLVPASLAKLIEEGKATAILIVQGTLYPKGRFFPVLIKGIEPRQKVLLFPSKYLETSNPDEIPAVMGSRMANTCNLKIGDTVTLRWRDKSGAFDARELRLVHVMRTTVQSIDQGQVWISLDRLRKLTGLENEATVVTLAREANWAEEIPGWSFKSLDFLLKDIDEVVRSKNIGASIVYIVLLSLAMLAIFDTQVLSIWRRRKEIGTLMALGMTRSQVIKLFTLEGALHGVLAAAVAAIYGFPLLSLFARKGLGMPEVVDSYGFALGERILPVYSASLIAGTALLVMLVTTIVSFLPTRQIAKLKPTEALRGKIT